MFCTLLKKQKLVRTIGKLPRSYFPQELIETHSYASMPRSRQPPRHYEDTLASYSRPDDAIHGGDPHEPEMEKNENYDNQRFSEVDMNERESRARLQAHASQFTELKERSMNVVSTAELLPPTNLVTLTVRLLGDARSHVIDG